MHVVPPELIEEVRQLVQAAQSPRRSLHVSREVAAWLAEPSPAPADAPDLAARCSVPAAAPVAAPAPVPVPAPPRPAPSPAVVADARALPREAALADIAAEVAACQKCGLCRTRTKTVFADGSAHAELLFVGEAPGADEDRSGVPFVGRAGQLLTRMIEDGMRVPRSSVYICNVLKCRPPENRDPAPDEVLECEPYLQRQLEIIQPRVIVALGRVAAQTLLRSTESTGRLRGRWHRYAGIPLRVTYHPSYLLRQESEKGKAWEDLKEVLRFLGWPIVEKKRD
jgi:DNA polymerase